MSLIKPFRGFRYNQKAAGDINNLIAPPYDIIDAELMEKLHRRSAHNVIRLILPKPKKEDDDRRNRYTRAAELWAKWREDGTITRDSEPALYRYQMSFQIKTPAGIVTRERPGFVALLKLCEYHEGKVRPHERTMAGPKEDRFRLMRECRAHFSQVFLLYPDKKGAIDGALGDAPPKGTAAVNCEDDAGVTHSMWPVTDADVIKAVAAHLDKHPVYIADGHHRYETGLALRKYLKEKSPLFAAGSDHIMAYFTPLEHPGLTVFPYHRLLHGLPKRRFAGLLKKLDVHFQVERPLTDPLSNGAPRREFMAGLEERGKRCPSFAMIDGQTGQAYYLSLKSCSPLEKECKTETDLALSRLDVVVLEDYILTSLLGIKHKDLLSGKHLAYETDYDRVIDAVQTPPNQAAFLLNPTPVADVARVADLQGVMPEKSTYFFPKLASGLVFNSMED